MRSETDISLEPLPQTGLPAVHVKLLSTQRGDGHRRVGRLGIIRSKIFRAQFEIAFSPVSLLCQTIHGQTQVRQDVIVNDVIKKYGFRVERFFRQDDAIFKGFVVADGSVPGGVERLC